MSQKKREDLLRKGGSSISRYNYDSDYPFAVYIANLGMYNDGRLVGEWVKFPTTAEKMRQTLKNIGIGKNTTVTRPMRIGSSLMMSAIWMYWKGFLIQI